MGTAGHTIRLYLTILKRYFASSLFNVALVIVAVVAADITLPYLTARVLDTLSRVATGAQSIDQAYHLFGLALIAAIVGLIAWRIVGFWISLRQATIVYDLERFVFERLTLHSYSFFADRFGGALVSQANRFVRSYQNLESLFFWQVLPMLVRLAISLAVLIISIPSIGLALLVWSSFFIASITWMVMKKQPYTRQASGTETSITARLADVLANILNLKSFGRRSDEVQSFRELSGERRRIHRLSWSIDEWVWTYTHVLGVLFYLVTLWLSIKVIGNHSASIGGVLLAQFYIARTTADLSELQDVMHRGSIAFGDAAEMTVILRTPPDIQDVASPQPLSVSRGRVQFEQVSFAYNGSRRVFHDFSLTIEPGERVGLVGHSGSGKTTLVKLLLRFAEVKVGRITIDGQDITTVAQDDLRSQIGYVAQEPILFHRSLGENIRYARPDATKEEIREVARLAHVAEFIEQLPNGYDTMVGERGIKLSGGEKQRVAIARAMLSAAPILVLDEATSSLDSKSEKLITEGLRELMKQRTTIVIAHRLSTIRNLDRIVVLDRGTIAEQGTHQALLNRHGLYHELWTQQTGGFLGE